MRRVTALVLAFALFASTGMGAVRPSVSAQSGSIVILLQIGSKNMMVDGRATSLDAPPVILEGRTLLPIRAVIEALGGAVAWDAASQQVTLALHDTTVILWIGQHAAQVNGELRAIDPDNALVVPRIIGSRTMLPIRFVGESMGCQVNWESVSRTVTITYMLPLSNATSSVAMTPEKGGTVALADGAKVEVPENALNKTTQVTLSALSSPPSAPSYLQAAGKTYEISIGDAELDKPVKVSLPITGQSGHLTMTHWNGSYWDILGGSVEGDSLVCYLKKLSPVSVKTLLPVSTAYDPLAQGYNFVNPVVDTTIDGKSYYFPKGICYGMAATSAGGIFKYQSQRPSTGDFNSLSKDWKKYILNAMEAQSSELSVRLTAIKDIFTDEGDIADLGRLFYNLALGKPVIIGLTRDRNQFSPQKGEDDLAGHAVVGYKADVLSNGSLRIYVYDPNYPGRSDLSFVISPAIVLPTGSVGYRLTYDYYNCWDALYVLGSIECSKPPEVPLVLDPGQLVKLLPSNSIITDVCPLPLENSLNRALVLYVKDAVKYAYKYSELYSCPDEADGTLGYRGTVGVALVDTRKGVLINSIETVRSDGHYGLPIEVPVIYYDLPYDSSRVIIKDGVRMLENPVLYLKDYNGDGRALEFALSSRACCNDLCLFTSLVGYSRTSDRVIQYPVVTTYTDTKGKVTVSTNYWCGTLFSKEPVAPGRWEYKEYAQGDYVSCRARYDAQNEQFYLTEY
jgi:hypothetical protein